MTLEQATRVADYLKSKKMGFCFMESGEIITREYLTEAYGLMFV